MCVNSGLNFKCKHISFLFPYAVILSYFAIPPLLPHTQTSDYGSGIIFRTEVFIFLSPM